MTEGKSYFLVTLWMIENNKITIKNTGYQGLYFVFTGGIYFRKKEEYEKRNFSEKIKLRAGTANPTQI